MRYGCIPSLNLGHLARYARGGFLFSGLPISEILKQHHLVSQGANQASDQFADRVHPVRRVSEALVQIRGTANFELQPEYRASHMCVTVENIAAGIGPVARSGETILFKKIKR